MEDLFMRNASPLSAEVWAQIDSMVVNTLKGMLVGRRFLDLVGPLGWGVENAPVTQFSPSEPFQATDAVYIALKEISADAIIKAKQLAMAADTPFALDLGAVAIAAVKLAREEDTLILSGLLDAGKKNTAAMSDWGVFGSAFKDIATACARLQNSGFDAPYVLVLNPVRYAQLAGSMQQGRKELEMIEHLAKGGIYQSPVMPESKVLVLSPRSWNMDMVVGQDAVTAYAGNTGLDHCLHLFETIALRVKLAGAIFVLA